MHAARLAHLAVHDLNTPTIFREEQKLLSIYSQPAVVIFLLGPNILLSKLSTKPLSILL
jgi:hypothetical protein